VIAPGRLPATPRREVALQAHRRSAVLITTLTAFPAIRSVLITASASRNLPPAFRTAIRKLPSAARRPRRMRESDSARFERGMDHFAVVALCGQLADTAQDVGHAVHTAVRHDASIITPNPKISIPNRSERFSCRPDRLGDRFLTAIPIIVDVRYRPCSPSRVPVVSVAQHVALAPRDQENALHLQHCLVKSAHSRSSTLRSAWRRHSDPRSALPWGCVGCGVENSMTFWRTSVMRAQLSIGSTARSRRARATVSSTAYGPEHICCNVVSSRPWSKISTVAAERWQNAAPRCRV
jgi:hypothetical protein